MLFRLQRMPLNKHESDMRPTEEQSMQLSKMATVCILRFCLIAFMPNAAFADNHERYEHGSDIECSDEGGCILYSCGKPISVPEYVIKTNEFTIVMPASDKIIVKGKVVFESDNIRDWEFHYNGASVIFYDAGVILLTHQQDCIDLYDEHIFVFDRSGHLRLSDHVWTSHYEDGFHLEEGRLVYWSEWYCNRQHNRELGKTSYVMVLDPGGSEFAREERSFESNCSEVALETIRELRLDLFLLTPDQAEVGERSLQNGSN